MKKLAIRCASSWLVLLALLGGLYYYAGTVEVNMPAPQVQSALQGNGEISLTWEPVEYATSYRIYRREKGGDWKLIKAVSDSTYSYSETYQDSQQYAVRACNKSGKRTTLSVYSEYVDGSELQ